MNRYAVPVMVVGMLLSFDIAADDSSEQEQPQIEERQERQERLMELHCRDEQDRPESWLDRSHSYMSRRLCEPAAWFDGFFGDQRALEETPVGTFIRLRNALEWDQSKGWSFGLRVRANIELPRVSDRVRLLISRDDDLSGELSDDGPTADDGADRTRLGLRFIARARERSQLDVDGTIRLNSDGLNPRLQVRYRRVRALSDNTLIRATQTGFWEREDGFGTTSRLDWEWLPDRDRLFRWSARGTFSEASAGVDWRTSLTDFRQLDLRTAIRTELGAFGYTRPQFDTEEYFLAVRLRRQFARPWLFYEIQPQHAWPLDPVSGRRGSDWRLTLTLEIQFENKHSQKRRSRLYWGEDAELDEDALDQPIPVEAPGESGIDPVIADDEDDPESKPEKGS